MPRSNLLLFGILLIAACNKLVIPAPPSPPTLIGQWKWIQQTNAYGGPNGIPYDTLTPANTGESGFLSMTRDSSWIWTVNGQAIDNGVFFVGPLPTPEGPIDFLEFRGGNDQFLNFIGSPGQDSIVNHNFSVNNDTLYISNTRVVNDKWNLNVFVRENVKVPTGD